jgi:hypothetical protein
VKPANLIAALVIGGSVILAAVVFALVSELLRDAEDVGLDETVARLERELADQGRETRLLRGELEALRGEVESLRSMGVGFPEVPQTTLDVTGLDQFGGAEPPPETEGLVDQMQLASGRFNQGIDRPRPSVLRELLGEPRTVYSQDCQPVTNPRLVAALETRPIAGFRLTMIRPALDSLQRIMERLQAEEPDIYAALGTAGALCARYVRGADGTVSSHAWGAAVDFTLKGNLDGFGDGNTQFGLVVLAEFFNDEGWFWGASFSREDSMHFEVGEGLLRQWVAEGRI